MNIRQFTLICSELKEYTCFFNIKTFNTLYCNHCRHWEIFREFSFVRFMMWRDSERERERRDVTFPMCQNPQLEMFSQLCQNMNSTYSFDHRWQILTSARLSQWTSFHKPSIFSWSERTLFLTKTYLAIISKLCVSR